MTKLGYAIAGVTLICTLGLLGFLGTVGLHKPEVIIEKEIPIEDSNIR